MRRVDLARQHGLARRRSGTTRTPASSPVGCDRPVVPRVLGRSRPWRHHRQVVEGIVYRYRTGVAWRDLPVRFGPWQTVWKRPVIPARDVGPDPGDVAGTRGCARGRGLAAECGLHGQPCPQHAATLPRNTGAGSDHKNQKWSEPDDHAPGQVTERVVDEGPHRGRRAGAGPSRSW
jgi:transposase